MGQEPDSGDAGWRPPTNPAALPTPSPSPRLPSGAHGYAGSKRFVGEARGVQARSEQDPLTPQRQFTVVTFRVERFDQTGNRLPPVAVQMRGRTFEGAISEGDWVEVAGSGIPSGTLHLDRVRNLTTAADVRAKGEDRSVAFWIVLGVVVVVVVVIFVVAIVIITGGVRGFPAGMSS